MSIYMNLTRIYIIPQRNKEGRKKRSRRLAGVGNSKRKRRGKWRKMKDGINKERNK